MNLSHTALLWIVFNALVLVMLVLDLLVFHRREHEVKLKEASIWSVIWITLGLSFAGFVYYDYNKNPRDLSGHQYTTEELAAQTDEAKIVRGDEAALKYLTGYVVEKSLSVDNLFVFLVIFSYFAVPGALQHRVLFWGIIGALVFRALFIFAGVALINRFHWIIYIFGAFLIFTGVKMIFKSDEEIHPEKNPVFRLVRRLFPLTNGFRGSHFFTRENGKLFATPLFVTLVIVETTDIIFAVDSIPAIMGFTTDPYLIYTSNVFAILGLRALYFALAGFMKLLRFLDYGLAAVLVFIGIKMLLTFFDFHFDTKWSLGIVGGILAMTVILSVMFPKPKELPPAPPTEKADEP